jgi:uncharacterized protein
MKLHQTLAQGRNLITAYDDAQIKINHQPYSGSLIITPERIAPWSAQSFEALTDEDFSQLLALEPEVVLFGSGRSLRFPHPRLTAALTDRGIGVEVMDNQAACRCYNILMEEDRRVVAVLLG